MLRQEHAVVQKDGPSLWDRIYPFSDYNIEQKFLELVQYCAPNCNFNAISPEMAQLYAQYTAAMGAYGTGPLRALNVTASTSSELSIARDVVLSGGRGGKNVKFLTGPPNSAVSGSAGRVFVTDSKGRVILDINSTRVKPVTPGQGFGPKRAPTPYELKLIDEVHGGG